MQDITTGRDPRRYGRVEGESIYATTTKEKYGKETMVQKPQKETEEREETTKTKPKERRETKTHEIEARNLGLKIYSSESYMFPKKSAYEEIVDGVKRGKYKMTFTDKRTETETVTLREKGKVRLEDEDLSIVPDDIFRKIRQGREKEKKWILSSG